MAKTNKGRKLFATTATAALVASAIVPVASAAQVNDFNSISSYAQEAVQDLVDRGVIQGDAKGNFNPKNSVTRAEAATILVGALDAATTGTINFTDVKAGAWYYDAINSAVNNGYFQGQGAGKFNPSGNLTRSEAAIILVNAFGLEGSASLSQFSDAASVKSWAQEALEIAVANGVMKGDNGKLNPNANITKQDFAVMFYRTEALEAAPEVAGSVKAINNTTVEVTFEDVIADVNALKFTIEGLEVTNAVVKQTDSKTVVLTTAAQTADTTYKVSVDGKEVGSFKGVSAVIPTAVKTVVASQQGVIGKEVTLSAEVTVAEGQSKAGIPVTFNITTDAKNNAKIEVEAITNDKGVATYSYTRYYNGIDEVVAYATSKSSVKDNAKVYWASSTQLTIKEAKEEKTVANGSKKVYEITGAKNSVVFVAFEENLNVKSNKVADGVVVTSAVGSVNEKGIYTPYTGSKGLTPYELSTGAAQYVAIELDKNGKGSLILTGSDDSVTPIVYEATNIENLDLKELDKTQKDIKKLNVAYGKLLLQDKAATVKFEQNDKLALEVKALGTEDAAEGNLPAAGTEIDEKNDFGLGGREYEVTVKTKTGELADAGSKAYLVFGDIKGTVKVIIDDVVYNVTKDKVIEVPLTVGKEGKTSFRVIGTGKDSYATPTVFLNTEGDTAADKIKLDKKDIQVEAETTYFTEAEVKEAVIKVLNAEYGAEVTSLQAGKTAYAVYQSVDQNGFAYGTGKQYDVTFELSTTFGELDVKGGEKVQNVGRTYTYSETSDKNGRAVVEFTADSATTVEIDILGSRNVLPAKAATVKFTKFATGATTGVAKDVDVDKELLTIGTATYNFTGATYKYQGSTITKAAFKDYIKGNLASVSVTKDDAGNLTFNVLSVGTATPGTADEITSAVLSEDGTDLTLTFAKSLDSTRNSGVVFGDFAITGGGATTAIESINGNKVVLSVDSSVVAGTSTVGVAADTLVYADGTTNAAISTVAITQPFASKLSTVAVSTASLKEVLAAAAKDATADAVIDDVTFTVTVDKAGTYKAENFNGMKVKFVAAGSDATPSAEYDAIANVITVKVGYSAADNTVAGLEGAIQGIADTAKLDFDDITLAVTGTTTTTSVVDVLDLTTPVTVELKDGLSAEAGAAGIYTFKLNTNLAVGNKVVLNGKTYIAGTDFVVATTAAGTQANLATAITAAITAGTETRFTTAVDATGVITLTDAAKTGATAPTLSLQ